MDSEVPLKNMTNAAHQDSEVKDKHIKQLESCNSILTAKLGKSNDELDEARKELIKNELAIFAQKKANEIIFKLTEGQKREKEKLHKKTIDLEKKLDAKQALELEIEQMRGAVQVMKQMAEDSDLERKRKMETMEKDLKDKEEVLEQMEELNQTLFVKELQSNNELQEARKELISGLKDRRAARAFTGVKRMGELDVKPFHNAAKRKYAGDEVVEKAMEMYSLREEYLRDPSWHPFKVISAGEGHKEIIDEEDEKLKSLQNEFCDEIYEAVTKALAEMNLYNPSGRFPLPELWNFKEARRAALKEGVSFLLKHWRVRKRKRN